MDLYRVIIGEDEYLGSPEEVVGFMARAEGAPGDSPASYMEGVAARLTERMDIEAIDISSPQAFLEDLARRGILHVEVRAEPSRERTDPEEALGDGPLAFGKGVDPREFQDG